MSLSDIERVMNKLEELEKAIHHMDIRLTTTEQSVEQIKEARREIRTWALTILGTIVGAAVLFLLKIG